jgi:hypothetical protein
VVRANDTWREPPQASLNDRPERPTQNGRGRISIAERSETRSRGRIATHNVVLDEAPSVVSRRNIQLADFTFVKQPLSSSSFSENDSSIKKSIEWYKTSQ